MHGIEWVIWAAITMPAAILTGWTFSGALGGQYRWYVPLVCALVWWGSLAVVLA